MISSCRNKTLFRQGKASTNRLICGPDPSINGLIFGGDPSINGWSTGQKGGGGY
jgi:hypothetical protein